MSINYTKTTSDLKQNDGEIQGRNKTKFAKNMEKTSGTKVAERRQESMDLVTNKLRTVLADESPIET